ncbi:hypothetical protein NC652_028934 [Populus alba x Populus x berolinensis]|nr:hypothetical protein NC652_028934 [Populus alba x Populus x berolinensis]
MISNEAKKTRDQPNLTECQSCGLRISSHKRLEILYINLQEHQGNPCHSNPVKESQGYMWFSRDPVDPRRTVYVVFGIYAE